ncbi:MAG: hypothetical protein AAF721_07055, partial [Myxococcota bacterium]
MSGGCDDEGGRESGLPGGGGKADCVGEACEANGPIKTAICEVNVADAANDKVIEDIAMDPDYVAKVLQCDFEKLGPVGLRAAAVAVRSTAYWQMASGKEVCSSDLLHCPNYTCDGTPSEKFREAAEATRGQYLSFNDTVTYGYYLAGEEFNEASVSCQHPIEDERVTYNDDLSGDDVKQSPLGKRSETTDANYGQNRGAMSVAALECLDARGDSMGDILRFFYGKDIEISQTPVDRDCPQDTAFDARFKVNLSNAAEGKNIKWADYGVRVTEGSSTEGPDTALDDVGGLGEAGIKNLEPGKTYKVSLRNKDQSDWKVCDADFKSKVAKEVVQLNVVATLAVDSAVDGCKVEQNEPDQFAMQMLLETEDESVDWAEYSVTASTSRSDAGNADGAKVDGRKSDKKAVAAITGLKQNTKHFAFLRKGTDDWKACDGEIPKVADTEQKVSLKVDFGKDGVIDKCDVVAGDDDQFTLEMTAENSKNSKGTDASDIKWDEFEAGATTEKSTTGIKSKKLSDSGTKGLVELADLEQDQSHFVWLRKSGDWTRCLNRVGSPDARLPATLFARFDNGTLKECAVGRDYAGTIDFGELHYGLLGYKQVLNSEGTTLNASLSYNEGDPGTQVLDQLDFRSDGLTVNLELSHPLIASPDFSLWAIGGFQYQDLQSDILSTTNTRDRLRVFKGGVRADWYDVWFLNQGAQNLASVTLFQGVDGLGATSNGNPNASRGDGRVDFTKITADWYRQQPLSSDFTLTANVFGQYAFTPL